MSSCEGDCEGDKERRVTPSSRNTLRKSPEDYPSTLQVPRPIQYRLPSGEPVVRMHSDFPSPFAWETSFLSQAVVIIFLDMDVP